MFPSNLLAGMFHKTKKPLYEIEDAAQRENVKRYSFKGDSTAIPFYPLKNKAVSGCIVCATAEGRCITVS